MFLILYKFIYKIPSSNQKIKIKYNQIAPLHLIFSCFRELKFFIFWSSDLILCAYEIFQKFYFSNFVTIFAI
jgi:hypothetical protein